MNQHTSGCAVWRDEPCDCIMRHINGDEDALQASEELDRCYAEAAAFDAAQAAQRPEPADPEDAEWANADDELRRGALDHKGRP